MMTPTTPNPPGEAPVVLTAATIKRAHEQLQKLSFVTFVERELSARLLEALDSHEALRARLEALERASVWRRVEEELPPRDTKYPAYSEPVQVRRKDLDGSWTHGHVGYDFTHKRWADSRSWQEWRPI